MSTYLGPSCLSYLWTKVKAAIVQMTRLELATISGTTLTAEVGKYYVGTSVGTLAITLPTPTENYVQSIIFYLETGASAAVTFSHTTTPLYAEGFEIESNAKCEVNALWNGTVWIIGQLKLATS